MFHRFGLYRAKSLHSFISQTEIHTGPSLGVFETWVRLSYFGAFVNTQVNVRQSLRENDTFRLFSKVLSAAPLHNFCGLVHISEKIMPEVSAWQNRPLETVYPFVFLDAIHYKVKENHQYQTKAAYVVLGITMDGTKDILGVWIGEHESSKFWLNVLNDLKSRGVLDVYLFCVDGLTDFVEAIAAAYPHSQVQRCIVHQIRSSTRFVSYKDIKLLMADLKKVYTAVTEEEALENLMVFKENWGKQYPSCVKSWENNWDILRTFFVYPPEIRKIIYTTNIIEGLNRQFRQITKNKPSFTNDDSLRKMLYLASRKIVEHWTARCRNWDMVLAQLQLMFQDRQTV